jgi:hypothetical protein
MTLPIDPTWICEKKEEKRLCSSGTLLASLPKMKSVESERSMEKDGRLKEASGLQRSYPLPDMSSCHPCIGFRV